MPNVKIERSLEGATKAANRGLSFERFGGDWDLDKERWRPVRKVWFDRISGQCGDAVALRAYARRLARLAECQGGCTRSFQLVGRLAIGMGVPHPIENGMTWHRILGTPYIPGSAIKGLVQAWAFEWTNSFPEADDERRADAERIFGQWRLETDRPDAKNRAGSVVFLDAVPLIPPTIQSDVMTPHHGSYYGGPDMSPTESTVRPVPVEFATVRDAEFQFAVMPRVSGNESGKSDCTAAMNWLEQALLRLGAGAKTRAHYGRFRPTPG